MFIGDLMLLDAGMLQYPPSLRAQCALILAAFLLQHSACKPQANKSSAGSGTNSESQTEFAGLPKESGVGEEEFVLPHLEQWDQNMREHAASRTTSIEATMCLQAVVHILVVLRRDWKLTFKAVEVKHASIARVLVYPESFPITRLVKYIL